MAGEGDAAVLLCDKPAGITSHDLVAGVRRERRVKTGHAGTLDPFATGLLVVLLGRATRLQRYLLGLPKTYLATARLGWRSSTGDPEGELTETGRRPADLALPTGVVTQRVPLTSAVKVGGRRLYERAHRGETAETPERQVTVYRADLIAADEDRATYEIECSAGTYVRTLVETLGDAYCETLRRTAVGPLRVEDAGMELEPAQALGFMPERVVDEEEAMKVRNGVSVASRRSSVVGRVDERVRLVHGGRLLAVARVEGDQLKPEVVLA